MPTLYETLQSRGRALTEAVREAENETDLDLVLDALEMAIEDLLRQKTELRKRGR